MKIPPPRPPIDREEVRRLREEEGLNGRAIADRIGCSHRGVRNVLKELGMSEPPARRVKEERWAENLYNLWRSIRQRCRNPRDRLFHRYGARGVGVCERWEEFWPFYEWAIASGYRPGRIIELLAPSKSFSPRSCRWITAKERCRRDGFFGGGTPGRPVTAFGDTKSTGEWARDPRCRITQNTLISRLQKGVPPEQAITLPPLPGSRLPTDRQSERLPARRERLDWERIASLHLDRRMRAPEIAALVGANEKSIRHGLKQRNLWEPVRKDPYLEELRSIWKTIHTRCKDEQHPSYRHYGAMGARVCAAWEDFVPFHAWGVQTGYRPGMCITRRRGTRVYSPRNCRWTTRLDAILDANRSYQKTPPRWTFDVFGERKDPTAWSRDPHCKVSLRTLLDRLRSGWHPEEVITNPPQAPTTAAVQRRLRAFGVTRGITEWTKDRRCKVKLAGLQARLERGIPAEEAISTPPFRRIDRTGRRSSTSPK